MSDLATSAIERTFALFLDIEQQAREAVTETELAYCIVNEPQALLGFRHAALVIDGKVKAVTGVTQPSPQAPFVTFIERACQQLLADNQLELTSIIDAAKLDQHTRDDWLALSAPEALWVPFKDHNGQLFGGMWIARDQPWAHAEQQLASQLGLAFAHAWQALTSHQQHWYKDKLKRKPLLICLILAAILCIPVRQTVLAPAEVIPKDPLIIAAPLDGVVQEFVVKPNQTIHKGDELVRFDTTNLQAQADVAEQALKVAQAEYRATAQKAFQDAASKARLDLLAAQIEQQRSERDYAQTLLARTTIRAEQDGIAVFADADEWAGKPVHTGEKLMQLADPHQATLLIELDVGDAISLAPDAPVSLFLDSDPLTAQAASLERIAYAATRTPAGNLAYPLRAQFLHSPPRIGLRGTAKVSGETVPLAVYLFRRPLAAIRQMIGW